MSSKIVTNVFLLIFAVGAILALFKFTNILNVGVSSSFDEGVQSLKRIIQEKPPDSELSEAEKEKLKETFDNSQGFTPFYCGSTYFPFIPGASWNYQVTSGTDRDVVRIGIPSEENGLVYLDGRLLSKDKWTIRTISKCQDGKIRLTDLNFFLIFARDRIVTTPCQRDQYNFSLPKDADMVKGNGWLENGCLVHDILDEAYNEKRDEIKEKLEVKGKILGQEDVKVSAGNFPSVKMELDFRGAQEIAGGAKTVESVVTFWVSPGVGIVKSIYQEKNSNKPDVIEELLGYQIPTDNKNKTH